MISEVLVRWFNAMKGVLGMAPDIILNANACTRFNFLALVSIWVALIHILQQYDRIGLMTAVYIHLHVLGLIPQVGPTALLHCIRDAVAFLVILVICSLKLSLLSRVTPRNFADLDRSIVVLPTTRGLSAHFLFQVNMTICVLSALMDRSLALAPFLYCVDGFACSVPDDI